MEYSLESQTEINGNYIYAVNATNIACRHFAQSSRCQAAEQ